MLRFFLLIVLVCAVGLGVYHFRDLPGTVQVDLPGFDEDFPVIVAGLILLLIGGIAILGFEMLVWVGVRQCRYANRWGREAVMPDR